MPCLYSIAHILLEHRLFLPCVLVVFLMSQHGTDIYSTPIVVDRSNQPSLIATNIEDGEFAHFICGRKHGAHFDQGGKIAPLHVPVPVLKSCSGVRMIVCKIV